MHQLQQKSCVITYFKVCEENMALENQQLKAKIVTIAKGYEAPYKSSNYIFIYLPILNINILYIYIYISRRIQSVGDSTVIIFSRLKIYIHIHFIIQELCIEFSNLMFF